MGKIAEHQTALCRLEDRLTQKESQSIERLNSISHSVLKLRSIGDHIMAFLANFPYEMRDLLKSILQSNWQMYQVLLQVQRSTARSPTGLLESNIKFEDALGEIMQLPYAYFRYWEVSQQFLISPN